MSPRNPNSGTSGSSSPSPSPSPNSGENRGNIVPQREEIQADETVPKEEEQSAADTADSASKEEEIPKQENPDEEIPNPENPVEEIPKPENPDVKIPEEEDPKEEDPDEENPVEQMAQEVEDPEEEILEQENPEPEIPQVENPKQEIPEQADPHEEIPPEGEKLLAYLSRIVPDIQMDEQQQMFGDAEAQNRQQAKIANQAQNQEQVIEAAPLSYYWSDNLEDYGFFGVDSADLENENGKLDAMYAEKLANEPKQENPDEEMAQEEEDPEEEILEQENPEPEIPQEENPKQEIPEQADPHEEIPPEGGKLFAYLSRIVPDIQMDEQQQMFGDAEAQNRQQAQIANQEQVIEAAPLSNYWSDNLEDYGFFGVDSATLEYENAKLDAMYAENLANEPNRGSGNRGQENPTIDSIPTFDPNRGMGSGEFNNSTIAEILAAISTVDLSRGMGIAEPGNPTIADIYRELENPSFGDMFSSIFPFEPNRGIANREPENPTIAEMFASLPPIEPNRGNGNTDPENPTNAEMLAALPPKKRVRMLENPTIDPTFDSRPAINPNKGFTIREPQNPTNNPAPAAVPEQQDKGKGKDKNPGTTEIGIYIPECFLFPGSTSEEEDDIISIKFISAYSRNHRPLPSAVSPEHFDTLFAFINSQLPQGESISSETLKEQFAKLVKKYLRLLRQRDMSPNFEALATNYDRELYRLGREVWGNAYAEGYRFPPGEVGTSETSGDSS